MTHPTAEASEQVNVQYPQVVQYSPRNTILQLLTSYTDPVPQNSAPEFEMLLI